MADGTHVGSGVVFHFHVQEHAPVIPGGEMVVIPASGGVRAHIADLVTVLVLPHLAILQCPVRQGDVGVPSWLFIRGTGARVLR